MKYTLSALLTVILVVAILSAIWFPHICGTPVTMSLEQQEKSALMPPSVVEIKKWKKSHSRLDIRKLKW